MAIGIRNRKLGNMKELFLILTIRFALNFLYNTWSDEYAYDHPEIQ